MEANYQENGNFTVFSLSKRAGTACLAFFWPSGPIPNAGPNPGHRKKRQNDSKNARKSSNSLRQFVTVVTPPKIGSRSRSATGNRWLPDIIGIMNEHPKYRSSRRLSSESLETRLMLTVPNFSLPDVNDESPRFGQNISPRDYQGQVTGWYFAHST